MSSKGSLQQLKLALKPLSECKEQYNQLRYDCPICLKSGTGLDKHNLEVKYISSGKGMFHCWACGYKGSVYRLIKDFGYKEYLDLFSTSLDKTTDSKKKDFSIDLPKYNISALNDKEVFNYLQLRGVTKDLVKERKIRYCYSDELKDCILFPNYNEQLELTGVVAHNYKTKKYKIFKSSSFTFFYEKFIDKNFPITITEGIYDCLVIPNSIPLLGLVLSDYLLDFLDNTVLVLMIDSDVLNRKQKQLLNKLKKINCKVIYGNLSPYKDINEYYVKDSKELKTTLIKVYEN